MSEPRRIGVVLFEDVEELDAVGPWEVLSYWCRNFPDDGWTVTSVSREGGETHCAKGLTIVAEHSFATVGRLDVLVYPGGQGTRRQLDHEPTLVWLREQRAQCELMTSVCTGSLVYAAAGLLTHRRATTHWASLATLSKIDPTIDVVGDERYIDEGDVITAAGVSAGIDMALHLVGRLASPDRVRQVRRGIQYDPLPPY